MAFLCENTNISEEFFEKYESLGVLNWECLCGNTSISEKFFEKYICKKIPNGNYFLYRNDFRVNHSQNKIISYLKKIHNIVLIN